jgi:hypothetical protein
MIAKHDWIVQGIFCGQGKDAFCFDESKFANSTTTKMNEDDSISSNTFVKSKNSRRISKKHFESDKYAREFHIDDQQFRQLTPQHGAALLASALLQIFHKRLRVIDEQRSSPYLCPSHQMRADMIEKSSCNEFKDMREHNSKSDSKNQSLMSGLNADRKAVEREGKEGA